MAAKVIVVTGASRGLGLAISKQLIRSSHKVVLASQTESPLKELKEQHPSQVAYLAADLTCSEAASQLAELAVKTFGRIDGLVINHGTLSPLARLENANIDEWKKAFDINLFSGVALVKATIPELRKSHGRVIFVSSGAALKGYTAWGAYGGTKAAMNSLCQHLAVEEPDVASVAVGPGRVDTDMQKVIRDSGKGIMADKDYAGFKEAFDEGHLNRPEEPGRVIATLAAEAKLDLSGKYVNWNSEELASYRDKA
ncbi:short-chain dehydrogenase [Magnaporthiopsis poae ATCC 64411]|uniref:Short-chain dehydrogenase n=1 Tax=Magnaporthiopsis poae (strain ATCC 64411 / 73-15) TaxID=644358 RepID=A0A0C4DQP0_MAGP6|nr:short-chain dehydrogenase [Magnaporthiopsis poae ATCC 64411]